MCRKASADFRKAGSDPRQDGEATLGEMNRAWRAMSEGERLGLVEGDAGGEAAGEDRGGA